MYTKVKSDYKKCFHKADKEVSSEKKNGEYTYTFLNSKCTSVMTVMRIVHGVE